ncbi:uncharacterized mitochondrial protein-like protein [Tanacetum coccineum]|uniref:Uncharacterized mitochondrial protein-like protein n=1 Tax=Tanacetum coccineum TaxID=301880 RepID=A0ABQ5A4P2_9ASTR
MQEELLQFKLQKVWVLVDLPYGKKVIGTKWVFRNKRDERSIVVKNKARLVAQGFRQEEGIDYDESSEDGVDVDVHVYRSMIGSLMYLTASRPDIMFAVCACARFQWDSPFELEAYSDSDYGGASLDRKSTTGGCQFLGRRLISWQCKKQTIVANSTYYRQNMLDCYEKRLIEVIKIHTDHNVADLLTKGFDVTRIIMDWRMDRSCAANFFSYYGSVVDFLKGTSLRYALTHNPTIYDSLVKQFWQTATVRTLANGTQQLVASIDSKEYTITEAYVRRDFVPLLPAMLAGAAMDQGDGSAQPAEPYHIPVDPLPSTSLPPIPSPPLQSPPHSPLQSPPHSPLQSPPHSPLQSPPHSPLQSPPHSPLQSPPYSPPPYSSPRSYEAPLPEGNTSGSAEASIQLKELMVKSIEIALKRKSKKVLVSALEGEELEYQGRIIQDINDDPLVSLFRESMKEKSTDFVTPTKASGEAQEEEISPTILEAAKTLSKVASQSVSKAKSTDKGKRYRRRARSMAKNINTGLDAEDEINTGRVEINTGIEDVNTGSTKVDTGRTSISTSSIILSLKMGQREGKAQMVEEDIHATHNTKEQIRQEDDGLEEAIRLQAQMDEEAEVQEAAQFYTEEDWDTIRAKLEANTEVVKSLHGEIISNDDFAKRMVEMINKKKFFAKQKLKAKSNEMNRNRLMRTEELYKFSDGTLNHVRTALNDIDRGIDIDYLPKRKWSKHDKKRACLMSKAIDRKLKDRRLMRNLEKFVGGRPYGGDLQLLERTI